MNWKIIERFNGMFSVSDTGHIRNNKTAVILKSQTNKKGYSLVTIKPYGRLGKTFCLRVHREVALAFIPTNDVSLQVNHIDGNKTNNHVNNLEWCTVKENIKHSFDNKLQPPRKGINNNSAKLSDIDILTIRKLYVPYDKVFGCRALAARYGVTHSTITRITNNLGWSHI